VNLLTNAINRYIDRVVAAERRTPTDMSDLYRSLGVGAVFCLALLLILAVTHVEFVPGAGLRIVTPAAVLSDEPYYIMAINGLLYDHVFQLQEVYQRVAQGGWEAGLRFRGALFPHHTILVDLRTGQHGLWSHTKYARLSPRWAIRLERMLGTYEVSAHPMAFPALMALLIAPFHPMIDHVEREVALLLALISWLGMLLTYLVARRSGMTRGWAMLSALLLVFASPWLAYSRSYFPESTIGLSLIVALWALAAERPMLAAFAAAVAGIFKPLFAVVGAGFIVDEIREARWPDALRMGLVLSLCGLGLVAFNYWLARTPLISGVQGWFWASDLHQLYDTFLEPADGILVFVPWTIIGFLGIASTFAFSCSDSILLRRMAVPIGLYLVVISSFGSGPGLCYGPRYWVAFLPWLAIATIQVMRRAGRVARVVCALLVLVAAAIAIPGALRYPQLFLQPPSAAWRGLY